MFVCGKLLTIERTYAVDGETYDFIDQPQTCAPWFVYVCAG